MLFTVTAVAAVLLSGKDFVDHFLAHLSQQTADAQWTDEELERILSLAEENGAKITEDIRSTLESSDPVYKEELLRLFTKIDRGYSLAAWPLEEQVWYDELLVNYGLKAKYTRFVPAVGEISEEEALGIARNYILDNWQDDVTQGQYTRYMQYMLFEDDESCTMRKIWDIEYEAEDGTVYVLCLTPDVSVALDVLW